MKKIIRKLRLVLATVLGISLVMVFWVWPAWNQLGSQQWFPGSCEGNNIEGDIFIYIPEYDYDYSLPGSVYTMHRTWPLPSECTNSISLSGDEFSLGWREWAVFWVADEPATQDIDFGNTGAFSYSVKVLPEGNCTMWYEFKLGSITPDGIFSEYTYTYDSVDVQADTYSFVNGDTPLGPQNFVVPANSYLAFCFYHYRDMEDNVYIPPDDCCFNGPYSEPAYPGIWTYYYPHVAANDPWGTEIAIINTSPDQSVTGTIKGYADDGRAVEEMPVNLAPRARRQIVIAEECTNYPDIDYMKFEGTSDNICGYTKFYQEGVFRAAVPAVKELNTSDIYVSHIASSSDWWTGLSLVNTNITEEEINILFNTGQSKEVTLPAKGHSAFSIRSLFDNQPQPDIESAVIKNAEGIVGLELFGSASGGNYLSGILLKDDTATTIYYPHIASSSLDPESPWWTGIVAYSPPEYSSHITVTAYSDDGTSLMTTDPTTIGANQKYIDEVGGLNLPPETDWIKINSDKSITGFELFGSNDGKRLGGYTGVGISGKQGVFPKLEKDGWTGIAFVNIENSEADVMLSAYDDFGNTIASRGLTLPGYAKEVNTPENFFTQDISDATYIVYNSDKNIAGFQLNNSSDDMLLDALPGMR